MVCNGRRTIRRKTFLTKALVSQQEILKEALEQKHQMTTNDIAKKLNRHPQTISKYERMFNLKIKKNESGHKVYSKDDLEKLKKIKKDLEDKDPRRKQNETISKLSK